MNKTFIRLYAFFCSLVIIGTLVFFGYKLSKQSQVSIVQAEKNFQYIASYISGNSATQDITTYEFLQEVRRLCDLAGNIDNASLANDNNVIILNWSKNEDTSPALQNTESLVSKPYTTTVEVIDAKTKNKRNYTLSAMLRSIPDTLLFSCIRDGLVIFSVLFLVTLMLLIIHYILNDKSTVSVVDYGQGASYKGDKFNAYSVSVYTTETTQDMPDLNAPLDNAKVPAETYTLDDLENIHFDTNDDSTLSADNFTDSDFATPNFTAQDTSTDEQAPAQSPVMQEEYAEPDVQASQTSSSESSTISKSTGIGYQQYLAEKLEYELGRATASEQDLCLMIFQLKGVSDSCLEGIAAMLIDRFRFRDLIFEYGESSFAVILPDTNLEAGMQAAETAYTEISHTVSRKQLGIGLTTRSARLVSAQRLIDEASSAVEKAFENRNSPIVAFRPDPKAYKEYLKDYT